MGNSKGIRFSVDVQIEACQMYMGNPSMTQQEVADKYGMDRRTLNQWLRKHGFSLKIAKRLPMPTKAERIAKNFKVLQTEHNKVKAELMQIKQAQQDDNYWLKDRLTRIAEAIKVRDNMEV